MNYDLSIKDERRRFVKRANELLSKQRSNVCLKDESNRTPNQNSYIHVLCRIMAMETGVSERYAKQVYFKQSANPDIFNSITRDPITGKPTPFQRSSSELTIPEMSTAIDHFIFWAAEQGYKLPEASLGPDGSLTFKSEEDKKAFHQAQISTSKLDEYDTV